jgi:hypothetical protein
MKIVPKKFRVRLNRCGLRDTLTYLVLTVLLEKLGVRVNREFEFVKTATVTALPSLDGFTVTIVREVTELPDRDLRILREYGGTQFEEKIETYFDENKRCVVVRSDQGELASVCWYCQQVSAPSAHGTRCGYIDRCFTRPEFRGLGLYPFALRFICISDEAQLGFEVDRIRIECSWFNHSSAIGIVKAGFVPTGNTLELWGQRFLHWPASRE